jgi:hypothetical protein
VDEADANEAIVQHWHTGWTALHGPMSGDSVPYVLEGDPAESAAEWVRLAIVPSLSALQTLDAQQRQRTGFLAVQVFTSPAAGTRRASALADDVRSVLEAQVVASGSQRIHTLAGTTSPGLPNGAWLMRLVTVPFSYYG